MLYQSYLSVIHSKYDSESLGKLFIPHSNSSVDIYTLYSVIDLTITEKIQTNKKSKVLLKYTQVTILLCGGHYLAQIQRVYHKSDSILVILLIFAWIILKIRYILIWPKQFGT